MKPRSFRRAVDGGGVDADVGVLRLEVRDALGRGDEADERDGAGARLLRRRAIARAAELPVASIGSRTIASRSPGRPAA